MPSFWRLLQLTLKPLSLSSFLSKSKYLRVFVNPLKTKYSLITSSKGPTAAAIAIVKLYVRTGVTSCRNDVITKQNVNVRKRKSGVVLFN